MHVSLLQLWKLIVRVYAYRDSQALAQPPVSALTMACEKLEANSAKKHGCDLHMLTFAVSAKPMEIINVLYLATDKNEGLISSWKVWRCFVCVYVKKTKDLLTNCVTKAELSELDACLLHVATCGTRCCEYVCVRVSARVSLWWCLYNLSVSRVSSTPPRVFFLERMSDAWL